MLWKKINIVFDISRSYNAISSNSGMAGVFNYEVNILTNIIRNNIYIYTIYLTAECNEDFFRNHICKQIKAYSRCKFINKNNLENIIKNIDAYVSFSLKIPEIIINYNIKNYLVIHDLLPLLHPDYYSSNKQKQLEAANFGKSVYDSINCNTTIITISENSKNDIEKYIIKDKQNKVINLSSGINKNKFFKIKHIANKYYKKYNFLNKKYILSVSNIRPYKNMIFLVNSFINFIDKYKINDLYLVLCGEFGEDIDRLFDNINKNKFYKDKIIITGFIPDKDINIIYNKAFCFSFPSLFEGFGLPVLEAIQCNIPVISSNITSLPEIYGDAGIGFNPRNEIELIDALHSIYFNENIRKQLIKNCNIQKKKFSIKNTARNYMNIIKKDYKKKNSILF